MQAVIYRLDSGLSVEEQPIPNPSPGEALIRVLRAGICCTDTQIIQGYGGFQGILGHEFVGIVQTAPPDVNIKQGDRVVGEINIACGQCQNCLTGGVLARNHCLKKTVLGICGYNGCFAEFITLPVQNLYKVPLNIPDEVAVFAEPLAAAFRIVEQGVIKKGDQVAIVGDGKLGLLIAEALQTLPAINVVIFGKHKNKLALVAEHIKKVDIKNKSTTDYENQFDVSIDATGHPDGIMMMSQITKPMGTVVIKTTTISDVTFNFASLVVKEQKLLGSRCGNFSLALHLLADCGINFHKYIAKVYPLKKADEAIKFVMSNSVLKVQLIMD